MELELKFTERDKKLIIFLSLFLLIVGVGYFVIRPFYNKVQELRTQADELEWQVEETQRHLSTLAAVRKQNEDLRAQKEEDLKTYYENMESQDLDKMITELTLSNHLTVKNLTIAISDSTYTVTPYYLDRADGDTEDSTAADSAQAVYDAETNGETDSQIVPEDTSAQILQTATLSLDISGKHKAMQEYIDLLSDDSKYPAIQITSYSWQTDNGATTNEMGDLVLESNEMLHLELAVYMQTNETAEKVEE